MDLEDMTLCCICNQTYVSPKSFPCLHTFCLKCLERYAEGKGPGERISCPLCRQEWKIPVGGVKDFPRNTFVEKLVELGGRSEDTSKTAVCDVCQENNDYEGVLAPDAVKHCISCKQNMCQDCAHHHTRQKLSKNHEVIDLKELKQSESNKLISNTCENHPGLPLIKYCLACETTVCKICIDQRHVGHNLEDVRLVAERVSSELKAAADCLKNGIGEVTLILNEELPNSFQANISKTESEIHARSEEVREIVDFHKGRLVQYLGIIASRRQKEMGLETMKIDFHLDEINKFLATTQQLEEQGSMSDMTGVGSDLLSRARELLAKHHDIKIMLRNLTAVSFTELKPIDIDSLLNYTTGNIVGKIKVNCGASEEKKDSEDYYRFSYFEADYDSDDPYSDCKYNDPTYEGYGITESVNESDYGSQCDEQISGPPSEGDNYRRNYEPESVPPPVPPRIRKNTSTGSLSSASASIAEIIQSSVILQERLCKGKFTEIWQGKLRSGRDVAIKTFTEEAKRETWIIKCCDFYREAEILQRLDHRNITKVIGISSFCQPYYVITELTHNRFLDKYLKGEDGRKMKFQDIISMTTQVADAMLYMETMNCIHRFLAASSILVGVNQSIKLSNFEMAVYLGTRNHGASGSYSDIYELLESPVKTRAPEVIESQRWTVKSDVWSFAIVIYEMLTKGAKPYPGMSDADFMNRILTTHDELCPAGLELKFPEPKLERIVKSCWRKDPYQRPDFKYLFESFRDYFKKKDMMGYSRPKMVKEIKLKDAISGVTMYKDEIFITRDNSLNIDVISASNFKHSKSISITTREDKTAFDRIGILRRKKKSRNNGLQDITVCIQKRCLCVIELQDSFVHNIDLENKEIRFSWQVQEAEPTSLSATHSGNLLLSCTGDCKILEYTMNGELIHEIDFGFNGEGPQHSIQLAVNKIVVGYGSNGRETEGVAIIDMYGKIASETKPLEVQSPRHLLLDSRNQVLVASRGINVGLLLVWNPEKGSQRILLRSKDSGRHKPTRIHLDEEAGKLLVGYDNGHLIIYEVSGSKDGVDYDEYYTPPIPFRRKSLPPRPVSTSFLAMPEGDDVYEELPDV